MARKPGPKQAKPTKDADDELAEEAISRLAGARDQKNFSLADIEECYYFAAPRRVRNASSQNNTENTHSNDADELCTSLGFEVAEDFMTMLIDSFMPQSGRWAERLADPFLRQDDRGRIEKKAREQDESIFQMIRGTNFHAELAKQGVPDAAIGVLAMMITDPGKGKPPLCVGVPIRELEMNLGPDGRVDDRFVARQTKYRDLATRLPGITLPKEIAEKVDEEPDDEVEVVWCYWRKWDREDDEVWQHVVLVDEEKVHEAEIKGSGCCPLVIGRFGATPDFAWPDGPMIKALPDMRQIDETDAAFIENIDFTLRPPFAYDDDGVLNFEGGIEPGKGYPRRPGAQRDTIEKIWQPNPLDAAMFQHDAKQRRVRRMHYVDFPEQVGKTPPTLGQWLDEMVEAQKKIGTPGYSFWREFPFEAFNRFRYIAETRGAIAPIEVNGAVVSLNAYNPAQRAQENQEVLTATRLMQIGASAFPQTWQVAVNDLTTLQNIKAKLGDKLVEFRTPEDIAGAADMVAKLGGVNAFTGGLGGGAGGGTGGGASYLSGGPAA